MSSSDAESAKGFLGVVRDIAVKVFKSKINSENIISASLAIVVETPSSENVLVRLLPSPDDGSQDFTARNRTGESLTAGDSVWLHRWGNNYTNTYIAIRN